MAGNWIKMRTNLWDDPRIARICDATNCGEAQVIGALYWLWATADEHTETGIMPGLSVRQINRKVGIKTFAESLIDIGWIEETPEGVQIINFEEHNGASAKKRIQTAKRVANHSAANAGKTKSDELANAQLTQQALVDESQGVSEALPKEDLDLDLDKNTKTLVPDKSATPACPHQEIIDAYHELCPTMDRIKSWTDLRKKFLQTRWRESPKHQSIDFWRKFFNYANQSPFLRGDETNFRADLEWLIRPTNFVKVIEGKYHNRGAA